MYELADLHLIAADGRVFLNDHRIGARRQGSAGENPGRLSGLQVAGNGMASLCVSGHAELHGDLRNVGGPHGIAVHGGHG